MMFKWSKDILIGASNFLFYLCSNGIRSILHISRLIKLASPFLPKNLACSMKMMIMEMIPWKMVTYWNVPFSAMVLNRSRDELCSMISFIINCSGIIDRVNSFLIKLSFITSRQRICMLIWLGYCSIGMSLLVLFLSTAPVSNLKETLSLPLLSSAPFLPALSLRSSLSIISSYLLLKSVAFLSLA